MGKVRVDKSLLRSKPQGLLKGVSLPRASPSVPTAHIHYNSAVQRSRSSRSSSVCAHTVVCAWGRVCTCTRTCDAQISLATFYGNGGLLKILLCTFSQSVTILEIIFNHLMYIFSSFSHICLVFHALDRISLTALPCRDICVIFQYSAISVLLHFIWLEKDLQGEAPDEGWMAE